MIVSLIGKVVGDYKIQRRIGSGGMGVVYQGIHVRLEQPVAIKDLSPELAKNDEMRRRFMQEAKIQARLNHVNVVNVHNLLESDGRLLMVMELVDGQTLSNLVQDRGALPIGEAIIISEQVLKALEFMHAKGVVHRDLKPGNIMITQENEVKVTDFGIAKAISDKGQTRTGVRLGTLWYMSPEQIKGKTVDVRSDLYAFGVTLFQMVTGKIPFYGNSDFEVMKGHMETRPPNPIDLKGNIPRPLSDIILKLLEKEPENRYQSASEVLFALSCVKVLPERVVVQDAEGFGAGEFEAENYDEDAFKELMADQAAGGIWRVFWIILTSLLIVVVILVGYYWYDSCRKVVIPSVKTRLETNNPEKVVVPKLPASGVKNKSRKKTAPIAEGIVEKKAK